MDAAKKSLTSDLLKNFTALKGLAPERFAEVVEKINIHDVAIGRYLFKHSERDGNTYFLIKGVVELLDRDDTEIGIVKGGTPEALEPLAPKQPRACSARVKKTATVAAIGTNLLEVLVGGDLLSGFEVSAIDDRDDDDWMSLMLRSRVFQKLPPVNISRLITGMEPAPKRADEIVFREGDEGDCYYTIKSGRCKVSRSGADGKEIVLAELGTGDSFGEDALLSDARRGATITMLTDGVLMKLAKNAFLELLNQPLATDTSYAEALRFIGGGSKWLDVRPADEYRTGHIAGSVNIPYAMLRDNVASLEPGTTYIVVCHDGHLSNAATFFLNQKGFDARVLTGGLAAVPADATGRAADVVPIGKPAAAKGRPPEKGSDADDAVPKQTYLKAVEARLNAEKELLKLKTAHTRTQQTLHSESEARGKAERDIHQLSAELDVLKKSQTDARKNTAATAARIEQQAREASATLAAEVATLRTSLADNSRALEVAEQDRKQLQQQVDELTRQLEETNDSAGSASAQMRGALETAEAKLRGANEQMNEAVRTRDEALAAMRRLDAELGDLKHQLETTAKGGEAMATQIQQAEQAKRTAVAAAEARRGEIDALQDRLRTQGDAHATQLDKLQAELAEAAASQASMAQAVKDEQARAVELSRELAELRQSVDGGKHNLETTGAELAQTRQALEDARARATELEHKLAAQQQSAKAATLESERTATTLATAHEEIDKARSDSATLREEIAQLIRQRDETQSRLAEAGQSRDALQQELSTLREQLEHQATAQQGSAQESAARQQALQAELAGNRSTIERLEQERQQAADKAQALARELDALTAGLTKSQRDQAATAREMETLHGQLTTQLADAQAQAEARAARIAELDQQLAGAVQTQAAQAEQLGKLGKELDAARTTAATATHSADETRLQIDQLRAALETASGERDDRQQQLEQAITDIGTLQAQLAESAGRAGESDTAAERLQGELDDLAARLADAEREARERIEQLEGRLAAAQTAGDDARRELAGRIAEAEAELSDKRDRLASTQTDAEAVIARIEKEAEHKIARLTRDNEELQSRLKQQSDKADALAARDKETTKALAKLEKDFAQSEKRREKLEIAIEKAKDIPSLRTAGAATAGGGRVLMAIAAAVLIAAAAGGAWWYAGDTAPESAASAQAPVSAAGDGVTKTPPAVAAAPAPGPIGTLRDRFGDGSNGPIMIDLPAGSFTMGASGVSQYFDERPQHPVSVPRFAISKYEVTFNDYDRFAEATGRRRPGDGGRGRGNRPVANISWQDATAYAEWLSKQTGHRYRLPTEAEWEYAARAGSTTFFWWNSDVKPVPANCFDCGGDWDRDGAFAVGKYAANAFGLHDTASNVEEWVQDCYHDSYEGAPTDGSARTAPGCQERVTRGGSFLTTVNDLRSSKRSHYPADTRDNRIGFRLARSR